jgi:hypothetical protein
MDAELVDSHLCFVSIWTSSWFASPAFHKSDFFCTNQKQEFGNLLFFELGLGNNEYDLQLRSALFVVWLAIRSGSYAPPDNSGQHDDCKQIW